MNFFCTPPPKKKLLGLSFLGVKFFWGEQKFGGSKLFFCRQHFWGVNIFGGQHFWVVNICWGSTFLGGQHFWGTTFFGGQRL